MINTNIMNTFGFLYELYAPLGERILTQSVSGTRLGDILDHIAKTINEEEYKSNNKVVLKVLKARLGENVIVNEKKMTSLDTLVSLAVEHYNQKAGKLIIETNVAKTKEKKLEENLKKVLADPIKTKKLINELELPSLEKGDILLVGKFKNRKAEIKGFDKDENNQPVAKTTKGDQKIFKPRIAKLMPVKEAINEDEGVGHPEILKYGYEKKNPTKRWPGYVYYKHPNGSEIYINGSGAPRSKDWNHFSSSKSDVTHERGIGTQGLLKYLYKWNGPHSMPVKTEEARNPFGFGKKELSQMKAIDQSIRRDVAAAHPEYKKQYNQPIAKIPAKPKKARNPFGFGKKELSQMKAIDQSIRRDVAAAHPEYKK
jgi:signal peptidase I